MFAEFLLLLLIFPWLHSCVGLTISLIGIINWLVSFILLLTISGYPFRL